MSEEQKYVISAMIPKDDGRFELQPGVTRTHRGANKHVYKLLVDNIGSSVEDVNSDTIIKDLLHNIYTFRDTRVTAFQDKWDDFNICILDKGIMRLIIHVTRDGRW